MGHVWLLMLYLSYLKVSQEGSSVQRTLRSQARFEDEGGTDYPTEHQGEQQQEEHGLALAWIWSNLIGLD